MKKTDSTDLLQELKNKSPNELQIHKWKSAVKSELTAGSNTKSTFQIKWYHLTAASIMGILIGGIAVLQFMRSQQPDYRPEPAQIDRGDATIEYAFYKSE